MLALERFALLAFLCVLPQISSANYPKEAITCYTKYDSEETQIQPSRAVLNYHYHHSDVTQYQTPENERCSQVGCVCFSYQAVCGQVPPKSNHVAQCSDADRHSRTVKWHRGWSSVRECEEMRRQPSVYHNLTCCNDDRCNNQPGKVIKTVDPPKPVSFNEVYGQPYAQQVYDIDSNPVPQQIAGDSRIPPPSSAHAHPYQPHASVAPGSYQPPPPPYDSNGQQHPQHQYDAYGRPIPQPVDYRNPAPPPRQQYDPYHQQAYQSSSSSQAPPQRSSTRRRTTTSLPDTHKPSEAYDKSLGSNASLLFYSFSNSMIFCSLLFSLYNMARSH